MKSIINSSLVLAVMSTTIQANEIKKYEIKSANIEYSINTSGSIMGMAEINSKGTARLVFDDFGYKELNEEKTIQNEKSFGKSKTTKIHTLNYLNGRVAYNVEFDNKRIIRIVNNQMQMDVNTNNTQKSESMLKKIGAKKIGVDKVAGYKCDIWILNNVKQCMYKGIPLMINAELMGVKTVRIATKVNFDKLEKNSFALPSYDIYNFEQNNPQKAYVKLKKSRLNMLDKKSNKIANQNMKSNKSTKKHIAEGMSALLNTGYNPNSNEELTPEQLEVMQKTMMKSMGNRQSSESSMLNIEKEKILKSAKMIPKARECFKKANNTSDANRCEKMMDSDEAEHHTKWNNNIKSNLLGRLNSFEKSVPCIKKAKRFDALEKCFMQ